VPLPDSAGEQRWRGPRPARYPVPHALDSGSELSYPPAKCSAGLPASRTANSRADPRVTVSAIFNPPCSRRPAASPGSRHPRGRARRPPLALTGLLRRTGGFHLGRASLDAGAGSWAAVESSSAAPIHDQPRLGAELHRLAPAAANLSTNLAGEHQPRSSRPGRSQLRNLLCRFLAHLFAEGGGEGFDRSAVRWLSPTAFITSR